MKQLQVYLQIFLNLHIQTITETYRFLQNINTQSIDDIIFTSDNFEQTLNKVPN